MQQLYLELRLHVDPVVVLRGLAIDVLLPVLAYHDDRRRVGCLLGKREIEKNERVGALARHRADQVGGYPDEQGRALDDDEAPRFLAVAPSLMVIASECTDYHIASAKKRTTCG